MWYNIWLYNIWLQVHYCLPIRRVGWKDSEGSQPVFSVRSRRQVVINRSKRQNQIDETKRQKGAGIDILYTPANHIVPNLWGSLSQLSETIMLRQTQKHKLIKSSTGHSKIVTCVIEWNNPAVFLQLSYKAQEHVNKCPHPYSWEEITRECRNTSNINMHIYGMYKFNIWKVFFLLYWHKYV